MVTQKDIEIYEAYAKLKMKDGDLDKINEMLKMLDGIDDIALDRDDYQPDYSFANSFREDAPLPSTPRETILANAMDVEAGCFSVPKIIAAREG